MTTGLHNRGLGAYGERLAARYLRDRGLVLLETNWTCSQGELDLVLRDGRTLVACEVKTRRDCAHGHPLEAVTEEKLQRLRRLADLWVEERGIRPDGIRIDIVTVLRPLRGSTVVEHVRGVC